MRRSDLKQIRDGRSDRQADRATRDKLKLKYLGLIYVRDDWRAEPKEFFFSALDEKLYIKHGLSDYKLLTQITESTLTSDEFDIVEREMLRLRLGE